MNKVDLILLLIFIVLIIVFVSVTTEEGRSNCLQTMREQNNPEYYILQELRKDK